MGVAFRSGMPGFGDTLTEAETEAVLAYIKST
jgi:mono/diheme cytochrome c family protein